MTAVWSTPSDFATAHIVTAPEWNAMNGASGNAAYIKDVLLSTASYSSPSRAVGTTYQNTTNKILFVTITCLVQGSWEATIEMSSTSPPTTAVCSMGNAGGGWTGFVPYSFMVPPNWYYRMLQNVATSSFAQWREWGLF